MLKEALMMLFAAFPRESASAVDLLPGVRPPSDTPDLNPEAATEVYTTGDAGPITVTCAGADTFERLEVLYVEIDCLAGDVIEVGVNYRLGLFTPGGAGFSVAHGAAWFASGLAFMTFGQEFIKDTNPYEPFASVAAFTITADGTYRFGVGCEISDSTGADVDAIFRDVSVQVTKVKR